MQAPSLLVPAPNYRRRCCCRRRDCPALRPAHPAPPLAPAPPPLQDDAPTADATAALQAAGVKLGADMLLQLAGLVRGGRDSVQAECKLDSAAEQLTLRKVRLQARACAS